MPTPPTLRAGLTIGLLLSLSAPLTMAHAEGSSPWSVRTGPVRVVFSESATVAVNGANVPGANAQAKDNTSLGIDVGYALSDRWTLRTAFGIPPTTTLSGTGSLAAAGTLGRVKYAPLVVSVTWKIGEFGPIHPYVGAGVNYTRVISQEDGSIAGLKVKSAFGSALQVGFDVPIDTNWGLFLDARKMFVKTTATGTLPTMGGASADASLTLNPLIVHTGVFYRF